eukprot:291643_1
MSYYEIRNFDGKGVGMVATNPIPAGTVILAEKPLLVVHTGDQTSNNFAKYSRGQLMTPFRALCEEDKARVLKLSRGDNPSSSGNNFPFNFGLVNLSYENEEGENVPLNLRNPGQQNAQETSSTFDTLKDIAKTNAIAMVGGERMAIYDDIMRINHSCRPNARWYFHEATGQQVVIADSAIKAGDEICTDYIDSFRQTATQRKFNLRGLGIKCLCELCGTTDAEIKHSDTLRTKYVEYETRLKYLIDAHSLSEAMSVAQQMLAVILWERNGASSYCTPIFDSLKTISAMSGNLSSALNYLVGQIRCIAESEGTRTLSLRPRSRTHLNTILKDFSTFPVGIQKEYLPKIRAHITVDQCAHCHDFIAFPNRCGRCRKVFYCTRACQVNNWRAHKSSCRKNNA